MDKTVFMTKGSQDKCCIRNIEYNKSIILNLSKNLDTRHYLDADFEAYREIDIIFCTLWQARNM